MNSTLKNISAGVGTAVALALAIAGGRVLCSEEAADIGIKFNNPNEAELRRQFGLLPKDQLQEAFARAVDEYFKTGSKDPVIVDLPPRPAAAPLTPTAP